MLKSRLVSLLVLPFLVMPLLAQDPALEQAEKELTAMFERAKGTPIGQEQIAKLGEFVKVHEAQDLKHLGYAKALHFYLLKDYARAVESLDAFFVRFPEIKNSEHSTMAGRVYLNAVREEANKPEPDLHALTRWGKNMTRLYQDSDMLGRMSKSVLQRLPNPVPVRVALAAGVFESTLSDAKKDSYLKTLYAEAAPAMAQAGAGRVVQGVPLRPNPAPEAQPADETKFVILRFEQRLIRDDLLHVARGLERVMDDLLELRHIERLQQIIVRPELHRFDGRLRRAVSRHQNDELLGVLLPDAAQGFEAVDAAHADVHEDEVGLELRNQLQSLLAAAGGGEFDLGRIKNAAERIQHVRLVIYQQQFAHWRKIKTGHSIAERGETDRGFLAMLWVTFTRTLPAWL